MCEVIRKMYRIFLELEAENMKGVIDRIEDGLAVILVEKDNVEFKIKENELPAGSKEGTWFTLDYKNGKYTIISIDEKTTKEMEQTSVLLMNKLKKRKKSSKFKRS